MTIANLIKNSLIHTICRWLQLGLVLLLLTSCGQDNQSVTLASSDERVQPNIVIIFADDMGYADVNPFSELELSTPHIDKLAEEGAVFTNFYVAQPVCSASRAALLTGSYSNRVGIQGALFSNSKIGLALSEVTLAETLKTEGYHTAHIGKWHLGDAPMFRPTNQGFDTFFGILFSNDMTPAHPFQERFNFSDLALYDSEKDFESEAIIDQSNLTQRFTERSIDFIRENKENPFFLYLAHPQPHVPLNVSEDFDGSTGQGLYADVTAELDWSVGEILNTLKEEGIDDNTLVIFTSDNGPWLAYGNHAGSAGPLREGKNTTFEGGVREPFLIRWPGHINAGYVSDTPFMSIDLFPTLAHLAGADLPAQKIDGKDAWAVLSGQSQESPQQAYFFYFADNELQGVRYQDWKLYYPHSFQSLQEQPAGADGEYGGYQLASIDSIELYDLAADPGESTNLAAQNPDVIATIEVLADEMRLDLGDSLRDMDGTGRRSPGSIE